MELGIGLNEMLITVTVFGFVLRARELGQAVKQSGISPALGSDFRAKTLQFRPVFIHFIQLMNDQMTDEIPFLGHKSQQHFLLQAHDGLAHRGATTLVPRG